MNNTIREIDIASIGLVDEYQIRHTKEHDKDYVKLLATVPRTDIPPILVRPYSDGYVLVDGHARLQAAIARGDSTIRAEIDGNADIEQAYEYNIRHGKDLSKEEKYDFVIFLSIHYPGMSLNERARRAGFGSANTVKKIMKEHNGSNTNKPVYEDGRKALAKSVSKLVDLCLTTGLASINDSDYYLDLALKAGKSRIGQYADDDNKQVLRSISDFLYELSK